MTIPPEELDLAQCLASGQVFGWVRDRDGWWTGADGDHAYRLRRQNDVVTAETTGSEEAFSRLFRLDVSLLEIRARLAEREPLLAESLATTPGLRLMRPSDATQTLFSFICSSNNHLARIGPMTRRLAAIGPEIAWGQHRFPGAATLAEVSEASLRAQGFGYRARSIAEAAASVAATGGEDWLRDLALRPLAQARAALMSLRGVGPKVADCVALYGLDKTEATPIDTHLWHAAGEVLFPEWRGVPLTRARYEALGEALRERFGELAGWAHLALYRSRQQSRRGISRKTTPGA